MCPQQVHKRLVHGTTPSFCPSSCHLSRIDSSYSTYLVPLFPFLFHLPWLAPLVLIPIPINRPNVLKVLHRSSISPCINIFCQCSCWRNTCPRRQRQPIAQRRPETLQRQAMWECRHRQNPRYFYCHSRERRRNLLCLRHQFQPVSMLSTP